MKNLWVGLSQANRLRNHKGVDNTVQVQSEQRPQLDMGLSIGDNSDLGPYLSDSIECVFYAIESRRKPPCVLFVMVKKFGNEVLVLSTYLC